MKQPPQKVSRFVRLAVRVWENQRYGTPFDDALVLLKCKEQTIGHRNYAFACLRFRQTETTAIECPPNVDEASAKIDVRPLKTKQFRYAHSCYCNQQEHCAVRFFQQIQNCTNFCRLECHLWSNRSL